MAWSPLIVRKKIIGAVAVQSYSSEKKYNESDLDIAPIGPALIENRVFRRVSDKFVSLFGYDNQNVFEKKYIYDLFFRLR